MALVLIRGESNSKLLNSIADLERHGNLNLVSKPKIIDAKFADRLVENILKSKLRTKSNVATSFFIKEDTTLSIVKIKKIHPPAHVVIISDEYEGYNDLKKKLETAPNFEGYYSHKSKTTGMKDYKLKNEKLIKNNKLNSYSKR